MKKTFIIFALLLVLSGCGQNVQNSQPKALPPNEIMADEKTPEIPNNEQIDSLLPVQEEGRNEVNTTAEETAPQIAPLPDNFDQKISFQPQAPTGKWVMPYQEFCEEAVLILADKHLKGEKLSKSIMDEELLALKDLETAHFNTFTDTSLGEVAIIAREYFKLDAQISGDLSLENIKNNLLAGNLIIAPTAGRLLGNPYFTGKGPIYHYLLIKGWTATQFITHDVGTWRGANFKYNYQTVIDAIHDLPKADNGLPIRYYDETTMPDEQKASGILTGEKKIIILRKQ